MPMRFGICLLELLSGLEAVLAVQGTTQCPGNRLVVLMVVQGDAVGKGLVWSTRGRCYVPKSQPLAGSYSATRLCSTAHCFQIKLGSEN